MSTRTDTDTDVVVVGAGIFGACVADHLLERGAERVILVESELPATATSRAGGGFVGLWAAAYNATFDATDLALEQYGIEFYRALAASATRVELRSNGNLFLALTEDGYRTKVASVLAHPLAPSGTRALSAAEVHQATGGVFAAGEVAGGVLHAEGVQLSAGRATAALVKRVVGRGGELRSYTRCNGLLTTDSGVVGVRTDFGDIRASSVVLACGAWSNALLTEVSYQAPLARLVATRAISRPSGVPSDLPTVMVPELAGLWLREHRGGLTWGSADGYAPLTEIGGSIEGVSQPRREDLVERLATGTGAALPNLIPGHDVAIDWWLQGVPCLTPDRRFLAGPVPETPGLYLLAGDNEAGVAHGPGLGRVVADLVLTGGSEWVDPQPYRLNRFGRHEFLTEQAVLDAHSVRQ
ncbi:FAD-binding oxidoreductase [Amycolatopsis rubida]|uniref:FAD-binding oxidoreductase n=1 Tax=Amycolatopsis rubida TaxID=112413 RepID=A0A1I5TG59_9PSEU|nr:MULTISPECIES: FAD-binding oxidoreductase [Amycolatopsis]MYW97916.1 FAD-dependent oxidoreductase [Amycolatopsis rubida]NEC62902.1 FAD-binding oxidoreductase [Amycolatopsis rubida]OAP23953.1 4-methylaminobutanoate oxidase (formaldehyde-forming) [Amycolatopsis sp. M39]SFP82054.1 Glycine/D-amino acid oxidase [Amycolatopsis rubida]